MAVKLRLMRVGKKKQPTYRVVAADSRSPRDGRFIEILGTYDPAAGAVGHQDRQRQGRRLDRARAPSPPRRSQAARDLGREEFSPWPPPPRRRQAAAPAPAKAASKTSKAKAKADG